MAESVPLLAIFGTGRSGSSWLGSIISSHPDVAYRFEPVGKLVDNGDDKRLALATKRLQDDNFSLEDLDEFYKALLHAHPHTEKPPFFRKRYSMLAPGGRPLLWPASKMWKPAGKLYGKLFTPRGRPRLVIKEVTHEALMKRLLRRAGVPVVYTVRHPAAVANSMLKGQEQGLMPTARRTILSDVIAQRDPDMPRRLGFDPAQLAPVEVETLLWRFDVEAGVRAALAHPRAMVVFYEELCSRTADVTERVFAHFGLDFAQQTKDFLRESTTAGARSRLGALRHGEFGINSYFSVFRDSNEAKDKWKKQLSEDDQRRVLKLVEESDVYRLAADRGVW